MRKTSILSFVFLVLVACNRDPKVLHDRCIASGNKYFQSGKYKEASIFYRRALQLDPKSPEAYYRLGLTDMTLRNYAAAARSLGRAWELNPANEDAGVRLAEIFLRAYVASPQINRAALKEARSSIDRLLKLNPRSYDALRLDADLATASNDHAKAIQRLREANELRPWQPETVTALMQNLALSGEQKEAEELGEKFLTHNKTFAPVYDLLYLYARQDSNPSRAEEILKAKVDNLSSDGPSYIQLATFQYSRNLRSEMRATLDRLRASSVTHAHILAGDFYFHIAEFDSATQSYLEGEKAEPKLRAAYQKRMAVVLMTQGRNQEAMQIATRLHTEDAKDSEAAAIHASLLAKGTPQQVQSAIGELESLATKEPRNAILQWNLGSAYRSKGDRESIDKARQHLEASLALDHDLLPARLELAQLQLERGENASAVQLAEEILRTTPAHLPAKLIRATGLANMRQSQRARAELESALGMYKDSNDARYQLASLNLADKRYREAESGFLALAQAGDARAIPALARCKEVQGQTSEAVAILEHELAQHPERDDYRMALADLEFRADRLDKARAALDSLAQRKPDSIEVLLRMGDLLNRTGERQAAVQVFQKTHRLYPSDPRAALRLAILLDATGQTDLARTAYEDALKLDPENALALNNLAYIKANAGVDLDQALGLVQHALRISPDDPNISDTLGFVHIRKKQTGQALQVLRAAAARAPGNPSIHLHLAMALADVGEKSTARKELEAATRLKPAPSEQNSIRELAARIR